MKGIAQSPREIAETIARTNVESAEKGGAREESGFQKCHRVVLMVSKVREAERL